MHCHCTLSVAAVHAVCSHVGKQGTIGDGPLGDLVALAGAVAIEGDGDGDGNGAALQLKPPRLAGAG